uniref:Uncharacterized protein n=1 Tax=Anopheles melas TaxID=34690 RepID=A0A182U9J4_9DIPT
MEQCLNDIHYHDHYTLSYGTIHAKSSSSSSGSDLPPIAQSFAGTTIDSESVLKKKSLLWQPPGPRKMDDTTHPGCARSLTRLVTIESIVVAPEGASIGLRKLAGMV